MPPNLETAKKDVLFLFFLISLSHMQAFTLVLLYDDVSFSATSLKSPSTQNSVISYSFLICATIILDGELSGPFQNCQEFSS